MAAAAGNASTAAARQPAINGRAAERNKDLIVPPSDPYYGRSVAAAYRPSIIVEPCDSRYKADCGSPPRPDLR